MVAAAGAAAIAEPQTDAGPDPHGWAADVDALLAERAGRHRIVSRSRCRPSCRSAASSSWAATRQGAASRLHRRLPARPDPHALLGTAFHDWVQRFYGAERLFDLDDLPGAVDGDVGRADAEELAELQAAFMASPWAARTPIDVEVPFEMVDRRRTSCGAASTRCSPTPTAGDGGGLEDRCGTAGRRRAAGRPRSSSAVYRLGVGGAARVPGVRRCGRRSTTCAAGDVTVVARPELPGPDELVALLQPPDMRVTARRRA